MINTVDAILEVMNKLEAVRLSCPLRAYMTEQGFDPDKGGWLILPEYMRQQYGNELPSYVTYTMHVKHPTMIMNPFLPRRLG